MTHTGNSLSEGFVRITYSGSTFPHHQMLPVNFAGTPIAGDEPSIVLKGGDTQGIEAATAAFMAEYRKAFEDVTVFGLAEVYAVDPTTQERTFLYGWNLGLLGLSESPRVPLSMFTLTFKTFKGGVLKIQGMETVFAVNTVQFPPYSGASIQEDITTFVLSDDSMIYGRDDSYAFSSISFRTKTSDVLRKRQG